MESTRSSALTPSVVVGTLSLAYCLYIISYLGYNLFFHPLRKVPGPWLAAATQWYWELYALRGEIHLLTERLHVKYGEIVRVGPDHLSFIGDQAWRDIYAHKQGRPQFQKTGRARANNGGYAITTAPDEAHARQRKMLSHAFSSKALQEQEPLFNNYIDALMALFREHAQQKTPVDAVPSFNFTTFDIIGDLSFGESFHNLELRRPHPWLAAVLRAIRMSVWANALVKVPGLPFVLSFPSLRRRMMARLSALTEQSRQRVERRIQEGEGRPDFMSRILPHLREDGTGISRAEINATMMVLVVAGAETTATLLSGCVYHLMKSPDVLRRLRAEVREAFKSLDEINMLQVNQLPYLLAVLEESLRLYPPIPIALPRAVPSGGAPICGIWVPEKTTVGIPQRTAYRSAINFADPHSFRPERWLHDRDARFENDRRDVFQPFSTGPRNCLGKNLAYAEMRLIIARWIFEFEFEMVDKDFEWDKQSVFTLWDKKPLMLWVKTRDGIEDANAVAS